MHFILFYRRPNRSRRVAAQQLHCEKPRGGPLQELDQVRKNAKYTLQLFLNNRAFSFCIKTL